MKSEDFSRYETPFHIRDVVPFLRSGFKNWRDVGQLISLGQSGWVWARLTAGFVMDLRHTPLQKYLMFFHGSSEEGLRMHRAHGHAGLGLAWSEDLVTWHWPGQQ